MSITLAGFTGESKLNMESANKILSTYSNTEHTLFDRYKHTTPMPQRKESFSSIEEGVDAIDRIFEEAECYKHPTREQVYAVKRGPVYYEFNMKNMSAPLTEMANFLKSDWLPVNDLHSKKMIMMAAMAGVNPFMALLGMMAFGGILGGNRGN